MKQSSEKNRNRRKFQKQRKKIRAYFKAKKEAS